MAEYEKRIDEYIIVDPETGDAVLGVRGSNTNLIRLGPVANKEHGTDPDEVPLNSDLHSVSQSGNHSELNLDDGTNPHGTTQADVGLSEVDNTSDLDKPVSTEQQNALNLKVDNATLLIAGTGLSGGGDLSENRTFDLDSTTLESLGKADTALQHSDSVYWEEYTDDTALALAIALG